MLSQETPKEVLQELLGQRETAIGASTCIFRQLNCRANMGFDNITDMLSLCSSSRSSPLVESPDLHL